MKNFFLKNNQKQHKFEAAIMNKDASFEEVVEHIENDFKELDVEKKTHSSPDGETIVLIIKQIGILEIHEIISKECTYICLTVSSNKKDFEKCKKKLNICQKSN